MIMTIIAQNLKGLALFSMVSHEARGFVYQIQREREREREERLRESNLIAAIRLRKDIYAPCKKLR